MVKSGSGTEVPRRIVPIAGPSKTAGESGLGRLLSGGPISQNKPGRPALKRSDQSHEHGSSIVGDIQIAAQNWHADSTLLSWTRAKPFGWQQGRGVLSLKRVVAAHNNLMRLVVKV
jgi:hypothetical protein